MVKSSFWMLKSPCWMLKSPFWMGKSPSLLDLLFVKHTLKHPNSLLEALTLRLCSEAATFQVCINNISAPSVALAMAGSCGLTTTNQTWKNIIKKRAMNHHTHLEVSINGGTPKKKEKMDPIKMDDLGVPPFMNFWSVLVSQHSSNGSSMMFHLGITVSVRSNGGPTQTEKVNMPPMQAPPPVKAIIPWSCAVKNNSLLPTELWMHKQIIHPCFQKMQIWASPGDISNIAYSKIVFFASSFWDIILNMFHLIWFL